MPYQCPFCERVNPSDAKFCNACGAPLHLRPCPECGAVNDAAATTCHQCAASLPGAAKSEPPAPSPGGQPARAGASASVGTPSPEAEALDREAQVSATLQELRELLAQTESEGAVRVSDRGDPRAVHKPEADTAKAIGPVLEGVPAYPAPAVALASEPRPAGRRVVLPRRGVIVTTAVLLVAALGYFAAGRHPTAEVAQTPAATGEVKGSGGAAEVDSRGSLATASEAAPAPSAPLPVPVVTPGVAPSPQPSPAASVAPGTVPPTATVAPAQQANATRTGSSLQREGQGSGAISAAPAAAASARPRAPETGTGIERPPPPRIGPCTDAVAALGLCTRESTQRRE